MKFKRVLVVSIVLVCLIFTSCEKAMKPDTPQNAAWSMKLEIDYGDYERFNNLFSQERKGTILKESFDEMKNVTTEGTEYTDYQLLTFENGEMLLVRLTSQKVNGEFKIEDVIIVPSEMKNIFE